MSRWAGIAILSLAFLSPLLFMATPDAAFVITILASLAYVALTILCWFIPKLRWMGMVNKSRIEELIASPLNPADIAGPFVSNALGVVWKNCIVLLIFSLVSLLIQAVINIAFCPGWLVVGGACVVFVILIWPTVELAESIFWLLHLRTKSFLSASVIAALAAAGFIVPLGAVMLIAGAMIASIGASLIMDFNASNVITLPLFLLLIPLVGFRVIRAYHNGIMNGAASLIMRFQTDFRRYYEDD